MCGFVGIIDRRAADLDATVLSMSRELAHRGPDDSGIWCDDALGIALGFRRLSIVDLSEAGHQPMISSSGRYVIVFNGEVYNFAWLRDELEAAGVAPSFRGHSDTEVILATIEAFGLEKALSQFVGMFAFALWDRKDEELHLVRDRVGIKPLYYMETPKAVLFGSELKALKQHPAFEDTLDRNALSLFMRHGYIPTPYTVYTRARKLEPGTILTFGGTGSRTTRQKAFWSASEITREGRVNPLDIATSSALDMLDECLHDAVRLRMIADVPLGVFLSGGIDSSIVAAIAQEESSQPVKTFSIGFHEPGFDEACHAREVARYLGTEHTELYVSPEEAIGVIPQLAAIYDEPFADSSQIPTVLVSRLARRSVTVALSGDGGDELFGGYNRYTWGRRIWRGIGWMPGRFRRLAGHAIAAVPPAQWDKVGDRLTALGAGRGVRVMGDKLHKLGHALDVKDAGELYKRLVSLWHTPSDVVKQSEEPSTVLTENPHWFPALDFVSRMMYLDFMMYLPDDILVKVDRASMAVSLEARVPLLDHRLFELAMRLPPHFRIRAGKGKWALRQVLYRYVPPRLVDRPKMGFGIPLDRWLRGPLREWAEALLSEKRLKEDQLLEPRLVREKWDDHVSGRRNWQYPLWNALMLNSWLDRSRAMTAQGACSDEVIEAK